MGSDRRQRGATARRKRCAAPFARSRTGPQARVPTPRPWGGIVDTTARRNGAVLYRSFDSGDIRVDSNRWPAGAEIGWPRPIGPLFGALFHFNCRYGQMARPNPFCTL